jgi:hypothetical protein
MEEELDATLLRRRYGRRKAAGSIDDAAPIVGSRHGHRTRTLMGTFGKTEIAVPRARIKGLRCSRPCTTTAARPPSARRQGGIWNRACLQIRPRFGAAFFALSGRVLARAAEMRVTGGCSLSLPLARRVKS